MPKAPKVSQLGREVRKFDPKLRVIANGNAEVNVVRTERCDALAVVPTLSLAGRPPSLDLLVKGRARAAPPKGKLAQPTKQILANVFISTTTLGRLPPGVVKETGRVGTVATATVPLSELKRLAAEPTVRQVSLGQGLRDPDPAISAETPRPPTASTRKVPLESEHGFGRNVLVGIVDVQGFDFAHPDFLDAQGRTRFHAIWDQGADADGTSGYPYGRVISNAQMNKAIAAAPRVRAPATQLEPQTQMEPGSHGTHVASIAAGNFGVAREATIAAVLISLGADEMDERRSFYDSTRLAHAVEWLMKLGEKLGMPVSVNVSLGTNGHAHDSSAPVNRWIDSLLMVPGRSVCVAAGNAGQEKAENPDDLGFIMGRIHTSGQVMAAGLDADIDWIVIGRDGRDYSENELELWFSPQDRIEVSVREPSGRWHGPVKPREFIENRRLADGTYLSLYNDLYHPANGANFIGVYLSPNMRAKPIVGIAAGQWTVRLHGIDIRDGRYEGWIERDDPSPRPPTPEVPEPWGFPSFFGERSNVDRSSISTMACGLRVIAVANLDAAMQKVNVSSSQGPTREGRQKPDVAAPGTDIVAANGFEGASRPWVSMTGTSMASPFVCGVVALMLARQRGLTAAQLAGILQRTARPMPGKGFAWENDAGFGTIDPAACVREAAELNEREDRTS